MRRKKNGKEGRSCSQGDQKRPFHGGEETLTMIIIQQGRAIADGEN